jgi:hypothetical protein
MTVDADTRSVLERCEPSHPVPVYADAHQLAEPNRTLVQYFGTTVAEAGQLHGGGGLTGAHPGFHCLLQSDDGQPVQMDVSGPSIDGVG